MAGVGFPIFPGGRSIPLWTENADTLLDSIAGHADKWGEIDEELKTGISKKGEMDLIKKNPRIVVKSPLGRDFETVLEILLNGGADLEVIQYLKRVGFEESPLVLPLQIYLKLNTYLPTH